MARILVLPGMGDILWVAVKLRAFCEEHQILDPEVYIWDFDGRPRSLEYVQRIPFVRAGGYWQHDNSMPEFKESYLEDGRVVFPDFHGFDYYISLNGALRWGKTVDEAMGGPPADWYFEMHRTERERYWEKWYGERFGRYIVVHLSSFGMFSRWVKSWDVKACQELLTRAASATGLVPVLTGCAWDREFAAQVALNTPTSINLTGETDLDQLFGLLRSATACLGWCGGNTIMATVLGIPTMMVWSHYFPDPRFFANACPWDALGNWYEIAVVEDEQPKQVIPRFSKMLERCGVEF